MNLILPSAFINFESFFKYFYITLLQFGKIIIFLLILSELIIGTVKNLIILNSYIKINTFNININLII